jgi:hypothetical protein
MRTLATLALTIAALGFGACGTDTATYHNAITGKACTPDMTTYVEVGTKHAKHPGCDANKCCIVQDGTCDNHPDAGGSGSGSGMDGGIPNPP